MSGLPFDEPGEVPALETGATTEPSVRQKVRVTNLYATPWHLADGAVGHELPGFLDLGRLAQVPRVRIQLEPPLMPVTGTSVSVRTDRVERITRFIHIDAVGPHFLPCAPRSALDTTPHRGV